jgi:biotin carboxyl carrier protein
MEKALKDYPRGNEPIDVRPGSILEPELDDVKEKFKDITKDIDDIVLCALYPVTGRKFLKWKYGLEEMPEDVKPKSLEQVKKEQDLVKKALSGELTAKGKGTGRELEVTVDGETFTVEISDPNAAAVPKFISRKKKKASKGDFEYTGILIATIPGMIIEYKKEVGDKVKSGEIVVVLEAMKMMNNLESNVTGVVKEIKFASGDSVSKGDVLMVIDPED